MTPDDDASVPDECGLYRRILPSPDQVVPDENRGCYRVSSAPFLKKREMSVVLEDRLRADGREPSDALRNHPGQYLIRLGAGFVRAHGQIVVRNPQPDEPAHGDVIGEKPRRIARAFAAAACWVVAPPEACAEDMC
jgi:hypothetical protein